MLENLKLPQNMSMSAGSRSRKNVTGVAVMSAGISPHGSCLLKAQDSKECLLGLVLNEATKTQRCSHLMTAISLQRQQLPFCIMPFKPVMLSFFHTQNNVMSGDDGTFSSFVIQLTDTFSNIDKNRSRIASREG